MFYFLASIASFFSISILAADPPGKTFDYAAGIYGIISPDDVIPVLPSGIEGLVVRASWNEIETSQDQFDFTKLDSQILALKNQNKRAILAITASMGAAPCKSSTYF